MRINKTKKITFRASETFADFLDEMSKNMKIERSELIRVTLMYFFMSHQLNKFDVPYSKLTEEFLGTIDKKTETEKEKSI
jgi:hypothetical protein